MDPRRPPPTPAPAAPTDEQGAWRRLREELRVRERLAKFQHEEFLSLLRAELQPPPPPRRPDQPLACSFCDALQKDVKKLIAGPTVYICDICVGDAGALMSAQLTTTS